LKRELVMKMTITESKVTTDDGEVAPASGGDADEAGEKTGKKGDNSDAESEGEEDGAEREKHEKQSKEVGYSDEEDDEDKDVRDQMDKEDDEEGERGEEEQNKEDDDQGEPNGEEPNRTNTEYEAKLYEKGFSFNLHAPLESRKLLMISMVERHMRKFVIRSVKGITRALVVESSKQIDKNSPKQYVIQTEGVNIPRMWQFTDIIKPNKIYSNHIYALLKTYGVEAARAAIMKEMKAVFGVYDISVDWRHLGLIADFMTYRGGFKPFNRSGMNTSVSPLQKMSFESCSKYLADAVLYGDRDTTTSTSSRITFGTMVRSGTGAFDLQVPMVKERK